MRIVAGWGRRIVGSSPGAGTGDGPEMERRRGDADQPGVADARKPEAALLIGHGARHGRVEKAGVGALADDVIHDLDGASAGPDEEQLRPGGGRPGMIHYVADTGAATPEADLDLDRFAKVGRCERPVDDRLRLVAVGYDAEASRQ